MAGDPYKFKLGLFVVTGLTLGVGGIFAIGVSKVFRERQPVYFYFEESVKGLESGAEISYRGIKLGEVTEVALQGAPEEAAVQHETHALIKVSCEIYPDILGPEFGGEVETLDDMRGRVRGEVREGLRAQLKWADISGKLYIALDYLDPDTYPAPDLGFQPATPYIPTATEASLSDIQKDLAATLSAVSKIEYAEISDKLVGLLDSIQAKVNALDMENLGKQASDTLAAVQRVAESEELRDTLRRMDRITASLETTVKNLEGAMSEEQMGQAMANLVDASASAKRISEDLEERLPALMESVEEVVATAQGEMKGADLPGTTESIRDAAGDVGAAARTIASMRDDLRTAMRRMSDAGRSVGRLAKALEERPHALLGVRRAKEAE